MSVVDALIRAARPSEYPKNGPEIAQTRTRAARTKLPGFPDRSAIAVVNFEKPRRRLARRGSMLKSSARAASAVETPGVK